jgi:hypothetical protein
MASSWAEPAQRWAELEIGWSSISQFFEPLIAGSFHKQACASSRIFPEALATSASSRSTTPSLIAPNRQLVELARGWRVNEHHRAQSKAR